MRRGEEEISLGLDQLERLLDSLWIACELDCSASSVDAVVNRLSDSLEDFQRLARQVRRITQSHEPIAWESEDSSSCWEQVQQQQQQQQAAAERDGVASSKHKPSPLQQPQVQQQQQHQQQQQQQQQPHILAGVPESGESPALVQTSTAVTGAGQSKESSSGQPNESTIQFSCPALEFAKGLPALCIADVTNQGLKVPETTDVIDPIALAGAQALEEAEADVLAVAADAAIAAVPSIKTRAAAGAVAAAADEAAGAAALYDVPSVHTPDENSSPGAYLAVFGDEGGNSDESGASMANRKLLLLSPRSRKRTPQETQSTSNAKQERAERLRELQKEEQLARMARAKETRQSARSIQEGRIEAILNKFEEKIARSEQLRLAHLSSVVQRASDETRKVAEVAFINQLLEEDKKLSLLQKLKDGGARRQEMLREKLARQRELALVAEEAAERRRLAEEARQACLSDKARKKEQAQAAFQLRLEEERRAAAAAREAAKETQKRILQELAAARAAANDARRTCIEDRLREAVARRASRLEMVKERAALFAGSGALASTGNCDRASSGSNSSSSSYSLEEAVDQVAAGGTSTAATVAAGGYAAVTNTAITGSTHSSHPALPPHPLRLPSPLPSPSEPAPTSQTPPQPPASSRRHSSSSPSKSKPRTPQKPPAHTLPLPTLASPSSSPRGVTGKVVHCKSSMVSPRASSGREGGNCAGNEGTSLLSPRRSSSSGRGSNAVARMAELLSQSSGLLGASMHTMTPRSASFSGGTLSKRPKPPPPEQQQQQQQQQEQQQQQQKQEQKQERQKQQQQQQPDEGGAVPSLLSVNSEASPITDSYAQPHSAAPQLQGAPQANTLGPGSLQAARGVAASPPKGKSKQCREEADKAAASPAAKRCGHHSHHHPPLCSSGMHVYGATNAVNRLKGMRRRSARVLARIKALRSTPQQPAEWSLLLASPEGASLLARWTQLVLACGSHPGMAIAMGDSRTTHPTPSKKSKGVVDSPTCDTSNAPPACATNGSTEEHAFAHGSPEERANPDELTEEHAAAKGLSKEDAKPSTTTQPGPAAQSNSLPVLGRAQRAKALHVAISAAVSDLSRPSLADVAVAAAWPSGLLAVLCAEVASAGSTGGVAPQPPWDPVHPALDLLVTLMQEPSNTDAVLASGIFPGLVRAVMRAFDSCNGGDTSGASCAQAQGQAGPYRHLTALLKVVTHIADQPAHWQLQPNAPFVSPLQFPQQQQQQQQLHQPVLDQQQQQGPSFGHQTQGNVQQEASHGPQGAMQDRGQAKWGSLREMHEQAVAYMLSSGLIHRMSEAFNLCDQTLLPHAMPESDAKGTVPPLPPHIIPGLHLLEALTSHHLPFEGTQRQVSQRKGNSKSCSSKAGDEPTSGTQGTDSGQNLEQHQQQQREKGGLPVPTTPNMASLSLAFQETSLAGLPMLLTAAMLHAAPKCLPYEAVPRRLPSNFLTAALSLVRALNNFARLDLPALQATLSSPALHVGFCHLMAFLTSYATNTWPRTLDVTTMQQAFAKGAGRFMRKGGASSPTAAAGTGSSTAKVGRSSASAVLPSTAAAGDDDAAAAAEMAGSQAAPEEAACIASSGHHPATQKTADAACTLEQELPAADVVALLNEVLLLLGHFSLLAPTCQGMLTWGRENSILHRLAGVPPCYFTHPQLAQVMLPTLAAACYGDERLCNLMAATVAPKHVALALGQEQLQQEQQKQQILPEQLLPKEEQQPQQQHEDTLAHLPDRYALESRFPSSVVMQMSSFFKAFGGQQDASAM